MIRTALTMGIYQQAYNADGTARGGEVRVNTHVQDEQIRATDNCARRWRLGGDWRSMIRMASGWGVYQQAYNADGTARGDEVRVNTYVARSPMTQPQITALANGGWVVTWSSKVRTARATASISRPTMRTARPRRRGPGQHLRRG